jgi:hypothetical protein
MLTPLEAIVIIWAVAPVVSLLVLAFIALVLRTNQIESEKKWQ